TTGGLDSYKDGKFTGYTTREGLASDSVETLIEDHQGSIWIGSSDGLTRFKDGVFTNFSDLGGTRTTVRALKEGSRRRLLVCTPAGLYLLAGGKMSGCTMGECFAD